LYKKTSHLFVFALFVLAVIAVISPACSAAQTAGNSAGQASPTAGTPSGQASENSVQPKSGQRGQEQNMQEMRSKLLSRVAEILGVSTESLTAAYEAGVKKVMGNRQAPAGSSAAGQPPQPPSENMTPPSGGWGNQQPDMSSLYSEIAQSLNLTVDRVTAAFDQARKELIPSKTQQ